MFRQRAMPIIRHLTNRRGMTGGPSIPTFVRIDDDIVNISHITVTKKVTSVTGILLGCEINFPDDTLMTKMSPDMVQSLLERELNTTINTVKTYNFRLDIDPKSSPN